MCTLSSSVTDEGSFLKWQLGVAHARALLGGGEERVERRAHTFSKATLWAPGEKEGGPMSPTSLTSPTSPASPALGLEPSPPSNR